MAFQKLYSQRNRDSEKEGPDVYQYKNIENPIRAQIKYIWDDAIGIYYIPPAYAMGPVEHNNEGWEYIRREVCKAKGRLTLKNQIDPQADCEHFLFQETDINEWLDLVEFSFRYIFFEVPKIRYPGGKTITQKPEEAIKDLNYCFLEANMGYQFENGHIIRVDNQLVHSEIVKPALSFLTDPRFSGPQEEFLSAHAHFRKGEYKDANTNALNAFESTLKTICDIKKWPYEKGSTAAVLLNLLREKQFFPDYLDKSFNQLIATLKTGLPKVRNAEGGHGQGAKPKETPPSIAAYALHLAAAKILLLAETLKESEK